MVSEAVDKECITLPAQQHSESESQEPEDGVISALPALPNDDILPVVLSFFDAPSLGRFETTVSKSARRWSKVVWESLDERVRTEDRSDAVDPRSRVIRRYVASRYARMVDVTHREREREIRKDYELSSNMYKIVPSMFDATLTMYDINPRTDEIASRYEFFVRFSRVYDDSKGEVIPRVFAQGFVRPTRNNDPERDGRYELEFELRSIDLGRWPSMERYYSHGDHETFSAWHERMSRYEEEAIGDISDKALKLEANVIAIDRESLEPSLLWVGDNNGSNCEYYYYSDQKEAYIGIGTMFVSYYDDVEYDDGRQPIFRTSQFIFGDDSWRLILFEDVSAFDP